VNTNLLNALKQIVSRHGGVETLSDARRVKALLADLAAGEPKPQKNALIACLEQGFAAPLRNVPPGERKAAKARMAERLNREEGLDPALCADTLDLLEAALFGKKAAGTAPSGAAAASGTVKPAAAPRKQRPAVAARKMSPPPAAAAPAPQKKEVWRELRTLLGHTDEVNSVAYRPDGRRIISGSCDSTIRIWDAESGRELQTLTGYTGTVWAVAYSPNGCRIASGSNYRHEDDFQPYTFLIWDAETGRLLQDLTGQGQPHEVHSVAYSPDGRRIASGSFDDTIIKIWDAESGRLLQTLTGHTDEVQCVEYSPDGRRIASGSFDGIIRIWDAETGRQLRTLMGHTDIVHSVAYSPDGRRIASGSGFHSYDEEKLPDDTVRIWDAETGLLLQILKGHTDNVYSVAYRPDGRRIVSGSVDNTIKIWGAE
jgi:hypothetical protein